MVNFTESHEFQNSEIDTIPNEVPEVPKVTKEPTDPNVPGVPGEAPKTSTESFDTSLWNYRAMPDPWSRHPYGVVDGDTMDLLVDMGMRLHLRVRVRLEGVNTSEVYGVAKGTPEFETGIRQSAFVEGWMADADDTDETWPLIIKTEKDERGKYGRLVAQIYRHSDEHVLNRDIVREWPETRDGWSAP